MTTEYNIADTSIGTKFLGAYAAHDWDALRDLFVDDITWELPGTAVISGRVQGVDAAITRVQQIIAGGTNTELLNILTGQSAVALSLHNTAQKEDGRVLDEYLTTLLRIRDGKIWAIETYVSDVPMVETFFGSATTN